jgi:hypothetical protein
VDIVCVEVIKMLISKYGNGSKELIYEFEKKYSIKFDECYIKFLENYNGGETPNTTFKKGKISETVRYLYGINVEESIEKHMKYYDWREKESIPIGVDNFGNYYAIGISTNNSGIIYFCDHEKGFTKRKIADDLDTFVKKCKSELINERAKRPVEVREKEMLEKGYGHLINEQLRETWKREYEYYKDMVQEEVIL